MHAGREECEEGGEEGMLAERFEESGRFLAGRDQRLLGWLERGDGGCGDGLEGFVHFLLESYQGTAEYV